MTKEQKDKILKALADDRNGYARDCQRRVEKEWGKIEGADYMLQRFHDILATEVDSCENDEILKIVADDCRNRFGCACCMYLNPLTKRCRLSGVPNEWEFE